ncbi:hypothetical protein N0B44_32455 [Roseibacterium beibuensis]|uniref:TrmB family transcriptional regulator n=1 Tax=[Roseibacterium] beibuensis TaxID=1193142 RepID=UPI00217D163F|nr:helix-turn-helix domain-containing protein [Roseibacterium beibuensis]MCS6627625.1 hypothetical protein [Roseibacterium beibuensis]
MTPEATLEPLGFTEIEALVYCELLRGGPSTGYRIAQGVGKAQANTYKALSTLTQKGAVIDDGGDPRSFRALPPDQLLEALARRFDDQKESAGRQLAQLESRVAEDRLYQLRSAAQVFDHARRMIDGATETVLFDAFPTVETALANHLSAASARGVAVIGIIYRDEPAGAYQGVRSKMSDSVLEHWPGAQLTMAVDASQHMVALLGKDLATVRNAVWSDSVYLSALQHYALSAEIRLHALPITEPAYPSGLSLGGSHPPGVRLLMGVDHDGRPVSPD